MAKSTTKETKASKDPIADLKKALLTASETKQKDAAKAISKNKEPLKQAQEDLTAKNSNIKSNQKELKALEEVQSNFNNISRAANHASAIAANVAGNALAKSITATAKAAKTALDSMEVTFPEASAMKARVDSVYSDQDTQDTKDLVNVYTENSKKATDAVEKWKESLVDLAISHSDLLNKDVVEIMAKITDLVAAVGTIGTDLATTTQETQSALAQDQKAAATLQATIDDYELQKLQNTIIVDSSTEFESFVSNGLVKLSSPEGGATAPESIQNKKNKSN